MLTLKKDGSLLANGTIDADLHPVFTGHWHSLSKMADTFNISGTRKDRD